MFLVSPAAQGLDLYVCLIARPKLRIEPRSRKRVREGASSFVDPRRAEGAMVYARSNGS
jgi:hypothetical protein